MKRPAALVAVAALALASLAPGCCPAPKETPTAARPAPPTASPTVSTPASPAVPAPTAATETPAPPEAAAPTAASWPGIRVDRERKQVDLDATVVLREGEWLELIACTPGTREHEAIVAVAARPSHIHLALLSLGLEPGHPIQSKMEGEEITVIPPQGPTVEPFFVVERDGGPVEIPAREWVVDQTNGQAMPPGRFLFTGSAFVEYEGKQLYMADLEGSVVSLVNFGDDLITRETTQTNQTDNAQWGANTEAIPPVGTAVVLRLRAVE